MVISSRRVDAEIILGHASYYHDHYCTGLCVFYLNFVMCHLFVGVVKRSSREMDYQHGEQDVKRCYCQ